jgi:hypothetical protein
MVKIILDPTNLYQPLSEYIVIKTEVEWVKYFTLKDNGYWIKGKRLCDWTQEWLKVWNQTDLIIEIKQNPRPLLESKLIPLSISKELEEQEILDIVTELNKYESNQSILYLLADITQTDIQFWEQETPSINHLAKWLSIDTPKKYQILEQFWYYHFWEKNKAHQLISYYQISNKIEVLKIWLGISSTQLKNLGKYPFKLPDFIKDEFREVWYKYIYKSEGTILDNINYSEQNGQEEIAKIAYDIFKQKNEWITRERLTKIKIYLNNEQKKELEAIIPPLTPKPLELEATPEDCLKWVTDFYLPFRVWETNKNLDNSSQEKSNISEDLALSFVNWIVKHYPQLKLDSVEQSWLNYQVTSQVENLTANNPVLWIVIDGLGWLDHQDLISKLTQDKKLRLIQDIEPRFSILPTKTEYAKWSLFTQLLPNHNSWNNNAGDGFSFINNGHRYTNRNKAKLREDLQQKKYQLYCWDTTQLDELYHDETDWQTLYKLEREKVLDGIVKDILHFLEQYPEPEKLQIIIASDHGQIIGEVDKINHYPNNLKPQGRMAIGTTDDSRFVVLSAQKFDLPHDISIVRNQDSFGSFNYTKNQKIIGSHGGLFPEEVVIGFSILSKNIRRYPIIITCTGEGKAGEKGKLEINIDNPNSVSLTNLYLYINEIEEFKMGKILDVVIPPNQKINHKLEINKCPELLPDNSNNYYTLSGKITFNFANTEVGEAELDSQSLLTIQQIFTSGFTGGLDEFF